VRRHRHCEERKARICVVIPGPRFQRAREDLMLRSLEPVVLRAVNLSRSTRVLAIFFIIFVDAIFTILFERLFTNVFDVASANPAIACVCRAGNAD
jgi:hypothetical protein